jgi:hypothetical protein
MDTRIKKFSEHTTPLTQDIKNKMDVGDWCRADGICTCPVCGGLYKAHKNVAGMEYMTLLCNETLVKL